MIDKHFKTKESGITLIALVVTIIVLLILAGVSIAMLTGENGILNQASKAKEETEIGKYKEALDVIRPGLEVEKAIGGLTEEEYLNRYEEEIKKDKIFENASIIREENTIKIITEEGYIFVVTVDKETEYIGRDDGSGIKPPELEVGDIEFSYNPSTPTNGSVEVTIMSKKELEDSWIEYSSNGTSWEKYETPIIVSDNGVIYARLSNEAGASETTATGNIQNIDRLAPKQFVIAATSTSNTITLEGSTEDAEATDKDGSSGIKVYYFSSDNGATWLPEGGQEGTSYTFNNMQQNKTYQLKMKAEDKAGNIVETDTIEYKTSGIPGLSEGNTTFSYNPSTPTNGDVEVTIETTVGNGYTLQYSLDGSSWQNYEKPIVVTQNGPIYARLIDEVGQEGGAATGNVENIDKVPPEVTISTSNLTETSVKLNVNATDDNGIESYAYYLNNTLKTTITTNSYTYEGLSSGEYTLKVIVTDKAGNTKEASTTVSLMPTLDSIAEGKYVNFVDKNGTTRKCVVLWDKNSGYGIQIITMEAIGGVELGNGTGSEQTSTTYFNKSKTSYNNAISTLNNYAMNYLNTTYASDARCVGSVPNNKNSETTTYFSSNYDFLIPYNGQFKDVDNNYTIDYNQMQGLGINRISNNYWLASRQPIESLLRSGFNIAYVDTTGKRLNEGLCGVSKSAGVDSSSTTYGIRVVFTLKSGIKITGGSGTSSNPYILGT